MNNTTMLKIAEIKDQAAAGVNYSPRTGATCPWCERKVKIYRSLPWEDATKIRYHRCENSRCPLASMRVTIKSIEIDK